MSVIHARTGLAAFLAIGAAVTAFGVSGSALDSSTPVDRRVIEQLLIPQATGSGMRRSPVILTVEAGDTLEGLLSNAGAADREFLTYINHDEPAQWLRDITPGRLVHAEIDSIGRVHQIRYTDGLDDDSHLTGKVQRLVVKRTPEGLTTTINQLELVRTTRFGFAIIDSSLFAATNKAGIPEKIANQVADIFGGDINFERDIRKGDQLRVIYETMFEPDSLSGEIPGRLVAAELTNRGHTHMAFWLSDDSGRGQYYDYKGQSVSKSFLRYPIEYARISSGFSKARMHPLSGKKKAHKGVDFAARPGTKIRASADGKIHFIGNQRGYGRTIILKHHRGFTSLYAHMQRFKGNLKPGDTVRQGDVIGYVGSSGQATGPHLHYELLVAGRHKNPLTVELPQAKPLDQAMRSRHSTRVGELKAQFAQLEPRRLIAAFE